MKSVVITGSTKGIGLGLAEEFLANGSSVTVSSRKKNILEKVVTDFAKQYGDDCIVGLPCDVTDYTQLQELWNTAKKKFGKVDIWINNAGIDTTMKLLWELDPVEISPVVNTNITGLIYGCKVALHGMLEQGFGQIYNTEGFGSADMTRPGMTVYGTTKRAIRYFTESLIEETRDKPIQIGTLGPGIVVTDFMLDNLKKMPKEQVEEVKVIYNILADKIETITPFLVDNILTNDSTGIKIDWLTDEKVQQRFNSDEYLNRNILGEFGF